MRTFLFAALTLIFSGLAPALAENGASTPELLKVDMDTVVQPNFLGVNAVYHGFAFMPEQVAKGMGDADRKREFVRVSAIKLRIARTWYTPDMATGGGLEKPFDWEAAQMKALYAWLAEMKKRNVEVALQLGWHFPRDARPLDRYLDWASGSLREIIVKRGFTKSKPCFRMARRRLSTPSGDARRTDRCWRMCSHRPSKTWSGSGSAPPSRPVG